MRKLLLGIAKALNMDELLREELAAAQERGAVLEDALRPFAEGQGPLTMMMYLSSSGTTYARCSWCLGEDIRNEGVLPHAEECLVAQARALLPEKGAPR